VSPSLEPQKLYPPVPRLRLRLELAGTRLPAWLAECVEALAAAEFIELTLRTAPLKAPRRGIYAWYQSFDRGPLGGLGAVLESRGLALTAGAEAEADSADVPAADVVLRIGLPPDPQPRGLRASWSIPAEDCDPDTQGRWMLGPFARGEYVAEVGLRVHDDAAGRFMLLEPGMVALAQFCFSRHRAYQLQKASAQLLRALRRVALGAAPRTAIAPPGRRFGVLGLAWLSLRLALRALPRRLGRVGRIERWQLAVRRGATPLDPKTPDASGFAPLVPPRGWFWADPAAWREDGRDWLFVEALDYTSERGEIHALELAADGSVAQQICVLKPPLHLSYPVLFRHQNDTILWVESAQARCVSAFRALQFPERWQPLPPVLPGWRAVDATPFQHNGRWWLFACVAESPFDDGGREWNELFLFHAEEPQGPWQPHPQNPVCTDVRRARPAGPVFIDKGRLIRPGQDCGREYGYAIVFHEITRLDLETYAERILSVLPPNWAPGLHGCHTYARHGELEVLDAKRLAPRREAQPDPRA
jgi:hypothetical protein